MIEYRALELGEVISALRALPEGATVRGLDDGRLHGDRGYYVRSALDPASSDDVELDAHGLADRLEEQGGKHIPGWKGGEYYVSMALPVAVAFEGDTGPYVAGFALASDALRGHRVYDVIAVRD